MVMAGGPQLPPVWQPVPFVVPGPLLPFAGQVRIPFDGSYTILSVRSTIGTPSVGAAVICDVKVNGTSIFTTQANRPTIPSGINQSTVTVPDVTQASQGSYLTMDVVQVGSTTPGSDLCVLVTMQRTA